MGEVDRCEERMLRRGRRVDLYCHCGRRCPVSVQTGDNSACPPGPVFQSVRVTVSEWSDWFYFLAVSSVAQ